MTRSLYSRALKCALVLLSLSLPVFAQGEKVKLTTELASFDLGDLNVYEREIQEALHKLGLGNSAMEEFPCNSSIDNSSSNVSSFASNILVNNNNLHRFNNSSSINKVLNDNSNSALKPLLCALGVSSSGEVSVLVTIPVFLKVQYQGDGAKIEISSDSLNVFGDFGAKEAEIMASSQTNNSNRLVLSHNTSEYLLLAVTHQWSVADFLTLNGVPIPSSKDLRFKYLKATAP